MQPEEVDVLLAGYLEDKGRYLHLTKTVLGLTHRFERIRDYAINVMASPGGQNLSGMPHASGVGKPTERIAVDFADEEYPDYVRPYKEALDRAVVQQAAMKNRIEYVEAWLCGLTTREAWIIRHNVIDNLPWRETVRLYQQEFGVYYSKDSLKRIKEHALEKIYRMAED